MAAPPKLKMMNTAAATRNRFEGRLMLNYSLRGSPSSLDVVQLIHVREKPRTSSKEFPDVDCLTFGFFWNGRSAPHLPNSNRNKRESDYHKGRGSTVVPAVQPENEERDSKNNDRNACAAAISDECHNILIRGKSLRFGDSNVRPKSVVSNDYRAASASSLFLSLGIMARTTRRAASPSRENHSATSASRN